MKQANFTYKENIGNRTRTIYGTVTLKDDGKVSISLFHASDHSYSTKFGAKKLAQEIVDSGFVHPSINGEVKIVDSDGKLETLLFEKTVDLKLAFIEKTKKYAKNTFDRAMHRKDWTYEQWLENFSKVEKIGGREFTKLSKIGVALREELRYFLQNGYDAFEATEVKYAEQHYKNSILKLAYRLREKGILDNTVLEISSGKVDVNFECYIKHNGITTKAWTIIAEGPVQRPHYRYLIK